MRALLLILCAAFAFLQAPAHAQPQRLHSQAELDALLAPIALYPDTLLGEILDAATYPSALAEAAEWSRSAPGWSGEAAVRAVQDRAWPPSVKALVAFPDLLARMAESPDWTRDLGDAFLMQQAQVMDTVQALRARAHAAGNLRSGETHYVEQQGTTFIVHPPRPQVVYVPYYDPLVVYGTWWWPTYRPVHWRPWTTRTVVVHPVHFPSRLDWQRRHVRALPVREPHHTRRAQAPHRMPPAGFQVPRPPRTSAATTHSRVPESRRQPIVQSAPLRPLPSAAPAPQGQRGFRPHNLVPR